jgi:diamine N-acetyltransferase
MPPSAFDEPSPQEEPVPAPTPLPAEVRNKEGRAFRVRASRDDDIPRLLDFYERFEPKRCAQGLPPPGRSRIERWLGGILPAGTHLLIEEAGRLVGHAMLMPIADGVAEYAIFLHQGERAAGLGTAVNRLAVEVARAQGLRRLWLSLEPGNRAALISYQRVGFTFLPGTVLSVEAEMELPLHRAAP